jgi:tetratricopeptide (TPR) repeat protein
MASRWIAPKNIPIGSLMESIARWFAITENLKWGFEPQSYHEAMDFFNEVIKENFSEAWNNKALSRVGLKNYEEAIICYDKAIEINPKSPDFIFNKANCLYFLKKYEDSIVYSNKIIKLNPEYAKGYLAKGQVLSKLDKIDDKELPVKEVQWFINEKKDAYNTKLEELKNKATLIKKLDNTETESKLETICKKTKTGLN